MNTNFDLELFQANAQKVRNAVKQAAPGARATQSFLRWNGDGDGRLPIFMHRRLWCACPCCGEAFCSEASESLLASSINEHIVASHIGEIGRVASTVIEMPRIPKQHIPLNISVQKKKKKQLNGKVTKRVCPIRVAIVSDEEEAASILSSFRSSSPSSVATDTCSVLERSAPSSVFGESLKSGIADQLAPSLRTMKNTWMKRSCPRSTMRCAIRNRRSSSSCT